MYFYSFLPDSYYSYSLFIIILGLLFIVVGVWFYDLLLLSSIGCQPLCMNNALAFSFILFIVSELLIFTCLFIFHFNALFYISFYLFISYPPYLLSSIYCFGLAFSNLLILLYSSFPLQCSIIYIKSGMRYHIIDSLGHCIISGYLFIFLQLIEFIYSFINIFDSSYYSIFFIITSIHGFHVGFGLNVLSYYFYYCLAIKSANLLFFDFHSSILFWSSYWHLIDMIWLLVFLILYLFICKNLYLYYIITIYIYIHVISFWID